MRASPILLATLCVSALVATAPADAATRKRYRLPARAPLIVPVHPRSFLDPGTQVTVGSQSRYVYSSQYPISMPYSHLHYGEPPLPGFGEGGRPLIEGIDFGFFSR